MDSLIVKKQKKDILKMLSKGQLKDAIDSLTLLASNLQNWLYAEKINELETNYKFMLHYQFEGSTDPEQETVYRTFLRTLYELTDDVTDELLLHSSSDLFFEKLRLNTLRKNTSIANFESQLRDIYDSLALVDLLEEGDEKRIQTKNLSVKRERIGSEMFISIFASPRIDKKDESILSDFVNNLYVNEREKCLFVSALTMNLFHRFDALKVKLLMNICQNESPAINQRAIVGLIIVLQMYNIRWTYYTECKQQLESLYENLSFHKSMLAIIKQLIKSLETEKISKRMTEEIIPEMLRFNSLAGKKLNMEDLMGITDDFSEKNPDWKKELESSGLANKLQEYSNLQMEGADVFHSTFSSLKSFPFFSEINNWFLPFDTSYSELSNLFSSKDKSQLLYAAIVNSNHMCDSDKYSLCFSLTQLPESHREMMLQKFGSESEELKQLQKEEIELNPNINDEVISNQYIQNLYRFFKLHPSKNSFFDIFNLKIDFYTNKAIAPFISKTSDMLQIASYCFDKNYFKEALQIYELITEKEDIDSNVWQKIAYCRHMLNKFDESLEAYLQADLIKPDNSWTIRRIAQLYRSLKQADLALQYYLKLQSISSENISTELNIGHCYLELGEYEKALNTYFKVKLLDGGDKPKSWRPIAWTSFLMKKFEQSQDYYKRILASQPTIHDYLNAGHVELAIDNKKEAINYYLQAIKMLNGNLDEFQELFLADNKELLEAGISKNLLPLLFDQLKYKLD